MERAAANCILCNSQERSLLIRQGEWSVYRCDGCGLGLLDPRPDPSELNELYRSSYFQSHYDKGLKVESPEMKRRLSQETHRIRFFHRIRMQGRLLDIGCGMGYFLLACRRCGYDVEGMDISADSAAYVQDELKIPVTVGTTDGVDYPPASFDVITMWHFLEHAREPDKYIEKARRWLKPDGILVVDVPNYRGTDARKMWNHWTGWSLPYHFYHFTPETLKQLLAKHGFRTIRHKNYLSEYVKESLERTIIFKPVARLIARFYSGHSFVVVTQKNGTGKKGIIKNHKDYFSELTADGEFRFARIDLPDIDNEPVIRVHGAEIVEQETCLFHRSVAEGVDYLELLHNFVERGMTERRPAPVVRFADGEYAFYKLMLGCNGLYRQAESVEAIRKAMPLHIDAFRRLTASGKMAPLIFPGNIGRGRKRAFLSFFRRSEEVSSASFLNFLQGYGIALTGENYIPFYAVYAYLTSETFARLVDGRKLCILNAEYNPDACREWFARFASRPEIVFIEIPAEYVATRWEAMREGILGRIPSDTDLCLAGAGVGALMVCVDAAARYAIPVLDAGHVLNMMNGREDKSKGLRMYTLRKSRERMAGAKPVPS